MLASTVVYYFSHVLNHVKRRDINQMNVIQITFSRYYYMAESYNYYSSTMWSL